MSLSTEISKISFINRELNWNLIGESSSGNNFYSKLNNPF